MTTDDLITSHLTYARRQAAWFCRRYAIAADEREDYEGEALLGLTLAASRFDATLGWQFTTFAMHYVRGGMHYRLRRSIKTEHFAAKEGHEFAEHLGYVPCVHSASNDGDTAIEVVHELVAVDARTPEDNVINLDAARLTRHVTEKSQHLIKLIYADGLNVAEASRALGKNKTNIFRQHKAALERMATVARRTRVANG